MMRWLMNVELERTWKEVVMTQVGYCSSIYLDGLENHENSGRIAGVTAEIQTEHLRSASLYHYVQTRLFGTKF
jgi:hypothetical protein